MYMSTEYIFILLLQNLLLLYTSNQFAEMYLELMSQVFLSCWAIFFFKYSPEDMFIEEREREREGERERERERSISCPLHAPWLGIEPAAFWYMASWLQPPEPAGQGCCATVLPLQSHRFYMSVSGFPSLGCISRTGSPLPLEHFATVSLVYFCGVTFCLKEGFSSKRKVRFPEFRSF